MGIVLLRPKVAAVFERVRMLLANATTRCGTDPARMHIQQTNQYMRNLICIELNVCTGIFTHGDQVTPLSIALMCRSFLELVTRTMS